MNQQHPKGGGAAPASILVGGRGLSCGFGGAGRCERAVRTGFMPTGECSGVDACRRGSRGGRADDRGWSGGGVRTSDFANFSGAVESCPQPQKLVRGVKSGPRHHPTGRFASLLAIHRPWAWIDPHLGMKLWTTPTLCGRIGGPPKLYTADRVYPPITSRGLPQVDASLDLRGHAPSTQPTALITVTAFPSS
jgi:hypothetical protein